MSDLKPCPFCGGTEIFSGGDDKVVGYFCRTCQAIGPNHYGSYDWNRRAAIAAVEADGWQLVPVEPTAEMIKDHHRIYGGSSSEIKKRYANLLAAAPKPAAPEVG